MEALVLIGGFLSVGALGFWVMEKIDRFLNSGELISDWDEAEYQLSQRLAEERASADPTAAK